MKKFKSLINSFMFLSMFSFLSILLICINYTNLVYRGNDLGMQLQWSQYMNLPYISLIFITSFIILITSIMLCIFMILKNDN